jgi:outer membrane protein assembly factor BamB
MIAALAALTSTPVGAQLPVGPNLPILPAPPGSPSPPSGNRPPAPGGGPAGSPSAGSVTFQVDPGHTGYLADPNLVPPLRARWRQPIAGRALATVAAEGRVFVLAQSRLYALDGATGREVWARDAEGAHLAYDASRLYVSGSRGLVVSYAASDGRIVWSREVARWAGPPTAVDDDVYVGTVDGVMALRGATGTARWTVGRDTEGSTVAVDRGRAFVAVGCGDVMAITRTYGELLWRHTGRCSRPASSKLAPVLGPRVYAPGGEILDAATGGQVGSHPGMSPPLLEGDRGVFPVSDKWQMRDLRTGADLWNSACAPRPDPGRAAGVHSDTLAIYHAMYRVAERGALVACSLDTGRTSWAARTSADATDFVRLAAAPGALVVATRGLVTAYESVLRPPAGGIAWDAETREATFHDRYGIDGLAGTSLRTPGARARIEDDEHPYGRWRKLFDTPLEPDGYFSLRVRSGRNTRLRVRIGTAVSAPIQVYVYPRISYRTRRGRGRFLNRITAVVSMRTDAQARLEGRRLQLYVGYDRVKRLRWLGSGRLRRIGPGRTRAAVTFQALRHGDFITACVPFAWLVGVGEPDPPSRRCGRRVIQY